MGAILAGSFLARVLNPEHPVYELCPRCANRFVEMLADEGYCSTLYPQPNTKNETGLSYAQTD